LLLLEGRHKGVTGQLWCRELPEVLTELVAAKEGAIEGSGVLCAAVLLKPV